ncbi:putative RNA-binding Zn ribbon-like protein [Kribbella aluminosa]|uniref:RNA-binding Zn ribbon-like protein n=1 Tax=Kribbella aluminosa TaxID=416017 RepID=A0ABS4UTP0_9ACTN|nr:CGNR zinc finger domain-containing protein [Kribbella aluminosa]MBP2355015.1 putative RNA-binding Zn ribbon-like protein [Kribbella aluminosa]
MATKSDRLRVQQVIVDLANSMPHGDQPELIQDVTDLKGLMTTWIVTESAAPTKADVESLHKFRARLRAVFIAPDRQAKISIVNELLSGADIHPRLVEHDGLPLHVHYFQPYTSLADHLVADCAMVLCLMFEAGEADRLKECVAPDCGTVFIDRSKNRSRLYCDSQACGNRLHAAAYRARAATAN